MSTETRLRGRMPPGISMPQTDTIEEIIMSPDEVHNLQDMIGRLSIEVAGIKEQTDRQGSELKEMSGAVSTLAQQMSRIAALLERIEKADDTRAETCPWRVDISKAANNREFIEANTNAIQRLWKADSDRRVAIAKWTAIGSGSGLALGVLANKILELINLAP